MSDTAGDKADVEIEILTAARARTDAEVKEVFGRVAQRHRAAILNLQQDRLYHERWVADQALRRLRRLVEHYEEMLIIRETLIEAALRNAELWRETARRHGAKVNDEEPAPQRGH